MQSGWKSELDVFLDYHKKEKRMTYLHKKLQENC